MTNNIEFSHNWNNKLQCKYFNTLRLSGRYETGQVYSVFLNNRMIGTAKCVTKIRYDQIRELPYELCLLDTGYSKPETIRILKTMYRNVEKLEDQPIYSYVFGFITQLPITEPSSQLNLFDHASNR